MVMRRPVDAADPARHALLGLLLEGPRHGYDLARAFAPGTALGSVVHLGASHLYALLARLERDGLLRGRREEGGPRPARRMYHLTETGRATVQDWLDDPVGRPRDVLVDFPLKLYLAQRLDRGRAGALVRHQRDLFVTYLADLERDLAGVDSTADGVFLRLLHQGRIARTRSTLEWLERCQAAFGAET